MARFECVSPLAGRGTVRVRVVALRAWARCGVMRLAVRGPVRGDPPRRAWSGAG
jgi:hypothetical protein